MTLQIKASDLLELASLYGQYMYHECAESNYSARMRDAAFKDFCEYARKVTLPVPDAIRLSHYAHENFTTLKAAGEKFVEVK